MSRSRIMSVTTLGLALLVGAQSALASGFAITEQSGRGQGEAYAGAAANANDPSILFFNPAGISQIEGTSVSGGTHLIVPTFDFTNDGSNYPLAGGLPLSGGGDDGGVAAVVPNLYMTTPLNDDLTLGFGIFSPYGLATKYSSHWVGRYHAIETDLATLNFNPTLSYQINDKVSLGVGVSVQYVDVTMSSAVDFGTILASQGAAVLPGTLDGKAEVTGDDFGYGYNIGLLADVVDGTRLGLAYRSKVEYTIDGDATFKVPTPATPLQMMGLFVNTSGKADLDMPDTASLSVSQDLGDKVTLLADATWTGWSSFEELRIDYGSMQPDSVTEEKWKDTMRYSLGANFDASEDLILRAGVAMDESPVPNKYHRTPRIPDTDRFWISLGATYAVSEDVSLDCGYTYIVFEDADTDVTGATGDRLVGSFDGDVNIFSFQVNLKI